MKKIKIITPQVEMEAELLENESAEAIWNNLPLEGKVNTWGDEIYFGIPLQLEAESAVSSVNEGDIAYWPEGTSFCIFFGKTPISTENEIKPASPVNVLGKLLGDPKEWKKVPAGEEIKLEKA